MREEVWKDIPGYEGRYQVSDLGRVRSLARTVRCGKGGKGTRLIQGKVLRPGPQRTGHLSVVLGHKVPGSQVHDLVMRTFVGPRPKGMDICHNNGDPTDNRLENLRYDTRSANNLDVYKIGKIRGKLTPDQVRAIRAERRNGSTGAELAQKYGVSQGHISAIMKGRCFTWLTD